MAPTIKADAVVLVPVDDLSPHPNNPRRGNVELIRESIRTNGFVNPVLAQRSRSRILAGEHRWRAAKAEAMTSVPVVWLDVDDDEALRILLVDNKAADESTYDPGVLAEVLAIAANAELALVGTGWTTVEYEALLNSVQIDQGDSFRDGPELRPPDDGDDETTDQDGALLALLDVTVGPPQHKVHHGQVYALGAHRLVIAEVMTEWDRWVPLLTDGAVLIPYPGAFLALTHRALTDRFVMVQPSPFIAGHLLDKWVSVHGTDSVSLLP